jgi:hypothetical protein
MAGVCLAALLSAAALAGEAMEMPEPTAEHERLGAWVGQWAGQGEMKPGPYGEGGPVSWTETCSWFGGGKFHVVCKSEGTGPMGPMKGLGIVGYSPEKKVFTHYGVDSTGWSGYSEGKHSDKTWTFQSEETMGGQTFHSRFTLELESPTRMVFTWQMSQDGESWMTMMEGSSEKKK